jgi:hypothetical protein
MQIYVLIFLVNTKNEIFVIINSNLFKTKILKIMTEMLKTLVVVLVALVAYDMFIKKLINKA